MAPDIDIAQNAKLEPITRLAAQRLGIAEDHLEPYGRYKAKLSLACIDSLKDRPNGKLILVTAISLTPGK
jgi:formate--tetrahydrofolate ligase